MCVPEKDYAKADSPQAYPAPAGHESSQEDQSSKNNNNNSSGHSSPNDNSSHYNVAPKDYNPTDSPTNQTHANGDNQDATTDSTSANAAATHHQAPLCRGMHDAVPSPLQGDRHVCNVNLCVQSSMSKRACEVLELRMCIARCRLPVLPTQPDSLQFRAVQHDSCCL